MTVLVAYASRYGSTAEIAERIAGTLSESGHEAVAHPVGEAGDVGAAEAVVVGSAVYMGHWRKEAATFVAAHRDELAARPVWLFSSGPLPGAVVPEKVAGAADDGVPKEVPEAVRTVGAREHRVFDGRLDPARLGVRDRLIRALPAGRPLLPEVDGRDWDAIDAWARAIARELDAVG